MKEITVTKLKLRVTTAVIMAKLFSTFLYFEADVADI